MGCNEIIVLRSQIAILPLLFIMTSMVGKIGSGEVPQLEFDSHKKLSSLLSYLRHFHEM